MESHAAADLIEELEETDMVTGGWLIRFRTLREALEHHIDEEEADVFGLARSVISDGRAAELGDAFEKAKEGRTRRP